MGSCYKGALHSGVRLGSVRRSHWSEDQKGVKKGRNVIFDICPVLALLRDNVCHRKKAGFINIKQVVRAKIKLPAGFSRSGREKMTGFKRGLQPRQDTHREFAGSIRACHGPGPCGSTRRARQAQCQTALRR